MWSDEDGYGGEAGNRDIRSAGPMKTVCTLYRTLRSGQEYNWRENRQENTVWYRTPCAWDLGIATINSTAWFSLRNPPSASSIIKIHQHYISYQSTAYVNTNSIGGSATVTRSRELFMSIFINYCIAESQPYLYNTITMSSSTITQAHAEDFYIVSAGCFPAAGNLLRFSAGRTRRSSPRWCRLFRRRLGRRMPRFLPHGAQWGVILCGGVWFRGSNS